MLVGGRRLLERLPTVKWRQALGKMGVNCIEMGACSFFSPHVADWFVDTTLFVRCEFCY